MTPKKRQSLLTTPKGRVLPDLCFENPYNAQLHKETCILLNARDQNVWMYEGNLAYPQKSFSLFDHNMGLMDIVLSQPLIQSTLFPTKRVPINHVTFAKKVVQGIHPHDGGERIREPMTALLKWSHPHLIPHAKRMEKAIAPLIYTTALAATITNRPTDFLFETKKIQTRFEKDLKNIQSNLFTEELYSIAIDKSIKALNAMCIRYLDVLSPSELQLVSLMSTAYTEQYNAIEEPNSPNHGSAEKFIKLVDKSCPSYTDHARQRFMDPLGRTILSDQLSNKTVMLDLLRSENPLITFMQIKNDPAAFHFRPAASAIGLNRISEYSLITRPVIFSGKAEAPEEPNMYAPRSIFANEVYPAQMAIVKDIRQTTHFLASDIKTNHELYATAKAKQISGEHWDQSLFNTDLTYSQSFVEEAENILNDLHRNPPVQKHPLYELPNLDI